MMKNYELNEVFGYQIIRTLYVLAKNEDAAVIKGREKGMRGHIIVKSF